MTLRFSERYVMGLNLLLIAVLAYFLALSVNDIILGRVAGGARALVPSLIGAEPSAPVVHPRSFYEAISRRDIFNLVPVTEAPAEVATNLHIRLLGTSSLTLSQPFIIVEDDNNHEQSLYRLGDDIPDAGKLVNVYKNHAIILHQGHRTKLEMPTDQNAAPSEMLRPFGLPIQPGRLLRRNFLRGRSSGQNGVRQIDPNRYVVDRSTVNNNLSNMAALFTEIRAVPNLGADGASHGFKLSEIQPDSIFQQIGLRDGDILTGVGGQNVGDPAKAIQLLSSLRSQSSISLTVMRGGQPVQFQYNIR
ncbi:MAG TPA: type II secretion system protein GspC [Candidatus Binataceae bacterium]|jgi:general secretion pathway protein C|nr:type II secretion system protein GspC [Candidatus Binataceae bacterium]